MATITINYDGRFTVKIGAGENVKTKLTLAKAYIDGLPDGEKGIIEDKSKRNVCKNLMIFTDILFIFLP